MSLPAPQSQYTECVYLGGRAIVIAGIAKQGTNCTNAYGRKSSANLDKWQVYKFMSVS